MYQPRPGAWLVWGGCQRAGRGAFLSTARWAWFGVSRLRTRRWAI